MQREPFQQQISLPTPNTTVPVLTVPQGKRLVIRFLSAESAVPLGQTMNRFFVGIGDTQGWSFTHVVGPSFHGPNGSQTVYTASQQLRMTAEPGEGVVVNAVGDATTAYSFISLSGYYVPVP